MQYRPTAAELLDCIAGLLEDDVLGAVPPELQHRVRVAANLSRILQREAELGPGAAEREQMRLAELLGLAELLDRSEDLIGLRAELAARLRGPGDDEFAGQAWEVLVATARDDVAIAKPGHDSWEGE